MTMTHTMTGSRGPAGTALRTPTADEMAAYERDGFVVARGLVPAEVLDAAERGMARFYAGDLDHPRPGPTRYEDSDWYPADGDVLRRNDFASRMVDDLAVLATYPGIGAFAAGLARAGEIRLWCDQLLYKPAGLDGPAANVGWHTDRQYWLSCSSDDMLTAWVPFHDCDARVGVVTFVPGSHRWEHPQGIGFFDGNMDDQEALLTRHGDVRFVSPELRRGDVTFHHCRTVHGSRPNLSEAPRRSLAVHLQDGPNHWVDAVEADGSQAYHRSDDVVGRTPAGTPDYTDPRFMPRLFPPA